MRVGEEQVAVEGVEEGLSGLFPQASQGGGGEREQQGRGPRKEQQEGERSEGDHQPQQRNGTLW